MLIWSKFKTKEDLLKINSKQVILVAEKLLREIQLWSDDVLLTKYEAKFAEFSRQADKNLRPLHQNFVERLAEGSKLNYCETLIQRKWEEKYPVELSG